MNSDITSRQPFTLKYQQSLTSSYINYETTGQSDTWLKMKCCETFPGGLHLQQHHKTQIIPAHASQRPTNRAETESPNVMLYRRITEKY